jgi:uncharacterized protein (DUF433 family)
MAQQTNWKEKISIRDDICHGKPCIKGTRIWVSLILDLLASGSTIDDILTEYPHLSEDDIRACIAYGAEVARERHIPIAMGD